MSSAVCQLCSCLDMQLFLLQILKKRCQDKLQYSLIIIYVQFYIAAKCLQFVVSVFITVNILMWQQRQSLYSVYAELKQNRGEKSGHFIQVNKFISYGLNSALRVLIFVFHRLVYYLTLIGSIITCSVWMAPSVCYFVVLFDLQATLVSLVYLHSFL